MPARGERDGRQVPQSLELPIDVSEPIPYTSAKLRIGTNSLVHRGDFETENGIATLCGKYPQGGGYTLTDDPVTCSQCQRALTRRPLPVNDH